jgi:hypothetical protein
MKRNCQQNRRYDEPGSAPEVELTPADKFRTATFLVIDNLVAELKKRKEAYATVASRFGFLRTMKELPDDKLTLSANQLCKIYPGDFEPSLSDELLQFSAFLKTELAERYLDSSSSVEAPVLSEIPSSPTPSEDSSAPSSPVTTTPSDDEDMSFNDNDEHDQTMEFENNDAMKLESPEVRMYKLILENKLETVFPNIEVALHIYLSLMISNCSGERCFSILCYIKNSYRSTMGQRRLNDLILLSAEQDILRELDINDFALMKSRKKEYLQIIIN